MSRRSPDAPLALEPQDRGAPDDVDVMIEMLEHMRQGIILYDRDENGEDVIRFFNSRAGAIMELPDGFLRRGLPRRELIRFCTARGDHDPDFDADSYISKLAREGETELLTRRPSGRYVMVATQARLHVAGSLTLYTDVSEKIANEQRLKDTRAHYKALADIAPTSIVKVDADGRVLFANAAAVELFEHERAKIDLGRWLLPIDGRHFREHLSDSVRFDAELRVGDKHRHVIVSISSELDEPGAKIATFADVTLLREARSRIEHLARHDPLTGLGNRTLFALTWKAIEAEADHEADPAHLVAIDLDRFKNVNDDHGHAVGDQLLQSVAARIDAMAGPDGQSFRLGGDEFALVLRQRTRSEALAVAEGLVAAMAAPFDLGGLVVSIGCSVGLASMPLDGETATQIQRAADVALYRVKRSGRNGVACFDPAHEREMSEPRRIEADLALALARGEFTLLYQPQMDLMTGRTVGVEALLRWRNERLGRTVPPSDFIPIAESSGLVAMIDVWVMQTAIGELRRILDAGLGRPVMSINMSPITLARLDIVEQLTAALKQHGVDPSLVEIEITEGVAIADRDGIRDTLNAFRTAGVRIAIDDFGAGHSSLAYIQSLPIDRVKIDRSIIEGLGNDDCTHAIVSSILTLCDKLGLKLTAEGIETAEQWEELRSLGQIDGQGYYLGFPETADDFAGRLRREMPDPALAEEAMRLNRA